MSKAERKAASDAARASVELEGFIVPENALSEAEKYTEGKISFQKLISCLYKQAKISNSVGS
ncbi:MAG: antitoxin VbhA family protein [Achromobacter veterisilvae]